MLPCARGCTGSFLGYVTWLYGQYATPEVDFVGKQESLREDLREVLTLFGLAFDEEKLAGKRRINEAEFNEEPVVWDPGLLREVQAAEGTAMRRYGYSEIGVKEIWKRRGIGRVRLRDGRGVQKIRLFFLTLAMNAEASLDGVFGKAIGQLCPMHLVCGRFPSRAPFFERCTATFGAREELMAKHQGFQTALLIVVAAAASWGWEGLARADGAPAVTWIESEAGSYWQVQASPTWAAPTGGEPATIQVSAGQVLQRIDGFGGAVSELGWQAIQRATPADQTNVINSLFGANGCNLNMARVPIGSSDFALGYYSDDDFPGDYNLTHFSIGRDQQNLIPFLQAAQQAHSNLQVWGVPWTPPAWMKTVNSYSGGSLTNTSQIMTTYANYLADWAQAYEQQGFNVMAVAPQNELRS